MVIEIAVQESHATPAVGNPEPYCVVTRAGHPPARRKVVKVAGLLGPDWVLLGAGTQRQKAFERLYSHAGRYPQCSVKTKSATARIIILAASDRVTLLTRNYLMLEPQMRGFLVLPLDAAIARTADGITMRTTWKATSVQVCFLDQLRDCVRRFGPAPPNPNVRSQFTVFWRDGNDGETLPREKFGDQRPDTP